MYDELEALAILRADICKLFPPGPVRERWLAWAELVAATDSETIPSVAEYHAKSGTVAERRSTCWAPLLSDPN
jgi:hypothetical protein